MTRETAGLADCRAEGTRIGSAEDDFIECIASEIFISDDIHFYYKDFGDHPELVYSTLGSPKGILANFGAELLPLVDFCLLKRLSRPDISSQYDLHVETAKRL